jgi:hypothetical protein
MPDQVRHDGQKLNAIWYCDPVCFAGMTSNDETRLSCLLYFISGTNHFQAPSGFKIQRILHLEAATGIAPKDTLGQ